MSEFIAQLFTDFTTTDSLIVLAFLFGAFLIGLFSGRASLRGKLKKWQKIQQEQAEELASLKAEKESLLQIIAAHEEDLRNQAVELKKATDQLPPLKQESQKYHTDWQNAQEQVKQLETGKLQYQSQLKALEATASQSGEVERQLRGQVLQLEEETAEQRAIIAALQQEQNNLQLAFDKQQDQLNTTQQVELQNTDLDGNRLQLIEDKISLLEKENQQLHTAIEDLQEGEEQVGITFEEDEIIEVQEGNIVELFTEPEENTEAYTFISSREKANIAKVGLKKYFGKKIPFANANQKDNLQSINGIGPFIEEQLNGIGIYTFEQISQFDDEIITLVTNAIQFFPGRIKRDNWQGQAGEQLIK